MYLKRDEHYYDGAADELIKEFRATLAYAKLTASDSISPKVEDKAKTEGEAEMTPPKMPTETTQVTEPQSNVKGSTPAQTQNQTQAQTMKTLPIPLTNAPWAMIQLPFPMTKADWDELMTWFKNNATPLTKGEANKGQ